MLALVETCFEYIGHPLRLSTMFVQALASTMFVLALAKKLIEIHSSRLH